MRKTLLTVLILSAAGRAAAQQVNISAEVDKNVVTLNDQISLSVSVSADQSDVPEPRMPSMPNFSVYSSGRSQSISIVNGRMSSSVVYAYVLAPRFVGKAAIPPITVSIGGKTFQTSPVEIQVVRPGQSGVSSGGNAAPGAAGRSGAAAQPLGAAVPAPMPPQEPGDGSQPGAPDVFVTASLDKAKAFVNEQATLTVRFFTSVPLLGNPQYTSPATSGFLTEDLPPERHGQTRAYGRAYNYSEIKSALFPAQDGQLSIGPATVQCQVQSGAGMDPFAPDFFQRFFSQGLLSGQTRTLKSRALQLTVEALPEAGKPASFSGAVGRFRVSASVDKPKAKVGEAVNLSVTIEGTGNLKTVAAPKLPELSAFRVYDTLSSLNLRKEEDAVRGSKIFKTVLVPRASGTLAIPPIAFAYFDPATRKYVQARTESLTIQAAPGAPAAPGVSYVGSSGAAPELTALAEDVRFVKETTGTSPVSRALARFAGLGWLHLIPLALFLSAGSLQTYREQIQKDPARARSRSALSRARKQIEDAQKYAGTEPSATADRLADALAGFLADKLDCATYGLTLREASERLAARFPKADGGSRERIKALWKNLDQFRFAGKNAGGSADAAALSTEVETLLRQLDRELR